MGLNFARINFAGPRLECAALATWWSLDLGAGRALACNYYTLRADASPNFPRSWTLQVRGFRLSGLQCAKILLSDLKLVATCCTVRSAACIP